MTHNDDTKKLDALRPERLLALLSDRLGAIELAEEPRRRARALERARSFASRLAALPQLAAFGQMPKVVTMLAGEPSARDLTSLLVLVERALERKVRDEDFLPARDDALREVATMPLRLVADSLRSSFNVGGLFRTGECFAVEELVLCGYSADPSDARVRKAALGTDEQLAWRRARRVEDEAERCRSEGRLVVALESEGGTPLDAFTRAEPCALFVGNERHGLASSFVERADVALHIPLHGRKNSLNVVSAAAIALAALRRVYDGPTAPCPEAPRSVQ